MLLRCNHVAQGAFTLHKCNRVTLVQPCCTHAPYAAQVHFCCTGAFTLHRCIYVAQVHLCCTGALVLHRCIHIAHEQWTCARVHCTSSFMLYTCTHVVHVCPCTNVHSFCKCVLMLHMYTHVAHMQTWLNLLLALAVAREGPKSKWHRTFEI